MFGRNLGGADRFGPTNNSKTFKNLPECFQKYVWFNRFCLCFETSGFSRTCFLNFLNFQDSIILIWSLWIPCEQKKRSFGTQEITPKLWTFHNPHNCHVMFCNRYWYHINKNPFMLFDGLISMLFKDLIRRIFEIAWCPPFQKLTKMEVEICKHIVQNAPNMF